MKNNIVVGTDFSENSINALKHATSIADRAKCNISLVWVETPGTTLGLMSENAMDYRKVAESRLEEIVREHKHLMPADHKINIVIRQGRPFHELTKQAEENDALMIVVGAHGVSGYQESFIGNNAYRTVMSAKCPVLTIHNDIKISRALTDIVLLVDSTEHTLHKLPFAIKMAKLFNAKIHLLALYTSNHHSVKTNVDVNTTLAEKFLREANVRYNKTILESFNIAQTTNRFVQEIDANLVVIMSEQDDFGTWLGDTSRDLVNKIKVPVLCIHPDDKVADIAK